MTNTVLASSALMVQHMAYNMDFFKVQNVPKLYLFSKHLQFLDVDDMALQAKNMGFDGVDLTVRKKGHASPENVIQELPNAIASLKKYHLLADSITTEVSDPNLSLHRQVLETAASLDIKLYRMDWLPYVENIDITSSITLRQKQLRDLSRLNQKLKITGMYQNHSGLKMGASVWELNQMLQGAKHEFMGVQYDIRHATVEGGMSWESGLRLVSPQIKSIVLKDFKWREKEDGSWEIENVPIGKGMVDFKAFFKMIKASKIDVPFILHFEYPLGGAEHGAREITMDSNKIYDYMKRDMNKVKELWQNS